MMRRTLPSFIEPMLAKPSKPFDSDDYLFEVKWDGTRALCFVDSRGVRLMNRRRIDTSARYPDLSFLKQLPKGTILDGEIIVMKGGMPDFAALQIRDQAQSARKIQMVARAHPAIYVAFDLLYDKYKDITPQTLVERRERARKLIKTAANPRLVMSEGVIGAGRAYFEEVVKRNMEGVVAKQLNSIYRPGKRTNAWLKIKRHEQLAAVIVGFVPEGRRDFNALIVAVDVEGKLRCVGKVGTGFDRFVRDKINRFLWANLRPTPVVETTIRGKWVEPGLYCTVRCMERTPSGQLRAPVFGELHAVGDK